MNIETNKKHVWINGEGVTLEGNQNHQEHEERFSIDFDFNGPVVYEVIRVMEGKPLFLSDHLLRLGSSFKATVSTESEIDLNQSKLNWSIMEQSLRGAIADVVHKNKLINNNIKLLLGNFKQSEWSGLVFPIVSYYPEKAIYESGVETDVVHEVRHNPQVKVINEDLTQKIAHLRQTTGIFEALLCDDKDEIAEGSKSNVFFVKQGGLITPPAGAVLKGITRQKVIEAAGLAGIQVVEEVVKYAELNQIEAAFLTGTSLHILPIRRIGALKLDSSNHPLVTTLMSAFEQLVVASQKSVDEA